jgi:hypothetical protein
MSWSVLIFPAAFVAVVNLVIYHEGLLEPAKLQFS